MIFFEKPTNKILANFNLLLSFHTNYQTYVSACLHQYTFLLNYYYLYH